MLLDLKNLSSNLEQGQEALIHRLDQIVALLEALLESQNPARKSA